MIVVSMFLMALSLTEAFALDCSSPPSGFGSSWWSQYASWCRSCGGTPKASTTSCTPGSNWGNRGSTPGYTTPQQPSYDGQAEKRQQDAIRRTREEAERRRQLEVDEREKKRRKEEARQKFLKDKVEALSWLKGTSSGTIQLKYGTAGVLGIKSPNPTGELRLKGSSGDRMTRAMSTEWTQMYCGMWITDYTFPAAKKGDVEEVRHLGAQVLKSFEGGPVELQCPPAQRVPAVPEGVVMGSDSPVEQFYQTLLRVTEKEAERVGKANQVIITAKAKQKRLHKQTKEKEKEVTRLYVRLKQLEPETQPVKSEDDAEKRRALEEAKAALKAALAALNKSNKAETNIEAFIRKAEKGKAQVNSKLDQYSKMAKQVQAKPSLASKYAKQIGK